MKPIRKTLLTIILLLASFILAGIWLLPGSTGPLPTTSFVLVLITTFWIGWFSVEINSSETDIAHILAFTYGIVQHPVWALSAAAAGLFAAAFLERRGRGNKRVAHLPVDADLPPLTSHPARTTFSLTAGFFLYQLAGGKPLSVADPVPNAIPFLIAAIGFCLIAFGLILVERRISNLGELSTRSTVALSMLIVIPLPIAMLGAIAYAILGVPALIIYCLLIGIASPFIRQVVHSMSLDQALRVRLVEMEGLEQFAESLAVALTSQDLHDVILDQALRATRAESGHLALFAEPDHRLVLVAERPAPVIARGSMNPEGAPELAFQIAASTQPFRSGGLDPSSAPRSPMHHEKRTVLGVPILDPGGNLGALVVERDQAEPFTDTDQAILVRIASQAAGAIRNARLYQELEQRLTEQSLLYQASAQIGETLETEAVALATADGLGVALNAHQVNVYQWLPEDNRLLRIASVVDGRPVHDAARTSYEPDQHPFMQTCLTERKIQRWDLETAASESDRAYLEEERKARSLLIAPLAIGQRTIGLLEITSLAADAFTAESERIAQSIAIQAAIALENTSLFQSTIEGHDRLMAVMNSTREGVIMIDLSGRMLLVNKLAGEFLGIDHRTLENRLISEPGFRLENRLGYQRGDFQNLIAALNRGTTYYTGSNTFSPSETESRFLQRNDSPVFDSDGDLIGWLIVLRDVTQQRELEESRNQLTEMIVHDLRGPLTAILSGLTLLKTHIDEGSKSPVVEQAITVSERSVHQMLGLVNSLLTISNLESGSARLNLEAVNLALLLREIAEVYLPEANKSGIIVELDLEPTAEVQLDREKIARVVSNLLDNALKFTPTGGQIKLSLAGSGEHVDIQIADTGPGIPMEYRERIFDRYGQIPGTSGRRRGTGLGLAFCKLAVDAHAGRIWVEDNPAGGSIFRILLPLEPDPDSPVE